MDTNQLLNDYMSWLRDQYTIKKIDQADEVTTPFLNMIGDNMRLYVERLSDSKLRLSDDGTTLENLLLYGINLNSPMRKQIMKETTHRYNVDLFDNVLSVTGTSANFPLMKQNLLAAMVTINDLSIPKKQILNGYSLTKFLPSCKIKTLAACLNIKFLVKVASITLSIIQFHPRKRGQ